MTGPDADTVTVLHGDCLDILPTLPDASVDAVLTDPPYALEFMGKSWDRHDSPSAFQSWCEKWARECLRVLKPGGYMLAFGGSRTYHRLTCGIEDAGLTIRDCITWHHGQGFPKAGDALKPASEPIVVARKPLAGTVASNVQAYGTGALNIDGCRIAGPTPVPFGSPTKSTGGILNVTGPRDEPYVPSPSGRWPANVVLSHAESPDGGDGCEAGCVPGCPVAELDAQSGVLHTQDPATRMSRSKRQGVTAFGTGASVEYADSGGASRFFPTFRYQAKAPTRERPKVDGIAHPTCKPLDLMRWLVRLVTPPGGTVCDPFAGSGTTAEACQLEGFRCIAIEREADYLPLIAHRLDRNPQTVLL